VRNLAIAFFSITALLSAWLVPNTMALLPLMMVSLARAAALLVALFFWVASGRLDGWGSSRWILVLLMIVGTVAVAGGCLFIQTLRDTDLPSPVPMIYRMTVGLLPVLLVAGVFLPSRKLFLIVAALAPVAGIVAVSTWKPLNAKYLYGLPEAKANRERAALLARRMSELDGVPESAGLAPLLEFVTPSELLEVRDRAMARIESAPDWTTQVSARLDGSGRLNGLYVLTRRIDKLPETVLERCWSAAASVAAELTERLQQGVVPSESDQQTLLDSVSALGDPVPSREHHWKELNAVCEFLRAAKTPLNTAMLDSWLRHSQLEKVPESAGIEPLLEFAGPSEVWDLKQEALKRIGKVPESTAKLARLLDGPYRLGALVVLAERVDQLPKDLRERCWQADALAAQDMKREIQEGKRPTPVDLRNLYSSAGSFWAKLGNVTEQHSADLALVRDVVRAAGNDWDKAAIVWADAALAPAESGVK
jgi:hypothetical protein